MYVFDCTIWGFHPLGKPAELTAQYLILNLSTDWEADSGDFIGGTSCSRADHLQQLYIKLVPYQPRIDVYKYSFLPRTVPEWNRLDAEIIETDCVEEFKQKLTSFMYIVK